MAGQRKFASRLSRAATERTVRRGEAPRPQDQSSFRPDLDGLRAVAIVAVVAFHGGVPGFDGGFVGVDVLFVISGFWHWPIMLLVIVALDNDALPVRLGGVLIALPVATGAYLLIENPLRFSVRLRASSARTYLVGMFVTAAVLVGGLMLVQIADDELSTSHREIAQARDEYLNDRGDACVGNDERSDSGIAYCVQGDVDAQTTVALVGDSHARQWRVAFGEAARSLGVRLVVRWSSGCPVLDVEVTDLHGATNRYAASQVPRVVGFLTDVLGFPQN